MEYKGKKNAGRVSQVAQLRRRVKLCKVSLVVGITLLIAMFLADITHGKATNETFEVSRYVNKYRFGSEKLTSSVQAYASTGEQKYCDDYIKELEVDKNREIAIEALKKKNLTESEWQVMNEIVSLSDGLVMYEMKAIEAVQNSDMEEARQIVFGGEYCEIVTRIKEKTEETIASVYRRRAQIKDNLRIAEIIIMIVFVLSMINFERQSRKTMKFARTELLEPIVKVSEYMEHLAKGELGTALNMTEDESEVGHMVASINKMRKSNLDIIQEIASLLGQMGSGNYKIEINYEYEGDYRQIRESLLEIADDMKNIVAIIQDSAKSIESGSEQLAQASDNLATACTTQAGQLSDVMLHMNSLEESINYNEKEAEEAAKISRSSEASLKYSNDKIRELKQTVGEIGTILAQIEVTGETAKIFETTKRAIEKGIMLAEEAVADTEETLVGAKETTERIDRIVEKLQTEVDNMKQINEAILIVAGIVDTNSMTADETAMVSEEQQQQVSTLVELVDQFII